jgi:hypothetical protein
MADNGQNNAQTWKHSAPGTEPYRRKADSLIESSEQKPDGLDQKHMAGRIKGREYEAEQLTRAQHHSEHQPTHVDKIFDVTHPIDGLRDELHKDAARKYARATMEKGPTPNMQIGSLPGEYRRADGTQVNPANVQQTRYEQGYRKEADGRLDQLGEPDEQGDASGTFGPVFYEGRTEHFKDNNPYRVTTKAVDDFVSDTASKLVGDREPRIERDENGAIISATPRGNQKRLRAQHDLANLSRTLLNSYDDLNLNIRDFRNVSGQAGRTGDNIDDIHDDDKANYNAAAQNYDVIAENLNYLNTDGSDKWSGTLRHNAQGGLSLKHGIDGNTELFTEDTDMAAVGDDIGEQIMDGRDSDEYFHFKPELSNYNIKVADKKSAVALGITLRQFFDLQVLYYKKHVEILQVFQLLVIFFEKYNYSINSLMYILEHMVKDKVQPKEGEPIEVPIPIDFTKSVIGMLADQKNMMNVISTFKSHLGMNEGNIHRVGDGRIFQPDDAIFLDDTHAGIFANAVPFYDGANYGAETYTGPNAQWYPGYNEGNDPVGLATYHVGDANGIFFPRTEDRDNRPNNPHPGAARPPGAHGGDGPGDGGRRMPVRPPPLVPVHDLPDVNHLPPPAHIQPVRPAHVVPNPAPQRVAVATHHGSSAPARDDGKPTSKWATVRTPQGFVRPGMGQVGPRAQNLKKVVDNAAAAVNQDRQRHRDHDNSYDADGSSGTESGSGSAAGKRLKIPVGSGHRIKIPRSLKRSKHGAKPSSHSDLEWATYPVSYYETDGSMVDSPEHESDPVTDWDNNTPLQTVEEQEDLLNDEIREKVIAEQHISDTDRMPNTNELIKPFIGRMTYNEAKQLYDVKKDSLFENHAHKEDRLTGLFYKIGNELMEQGDYTLAANKYGIK